MGPKCKMKRQVPLFKNYEEFQDSDSHALHQAQALLSIGPYVTTQVPPP